MRRQARMWGGGARVVRPASALQVWLWLLIFVFQNELSISKSIQPGYLDFDNLPETNFTCEGKVIGGYYADLETSCQMFHVCTVGQQDEPMDIKFLCLNGTVFDQETRVCERVDEVDCTKSEKFYSLNLELYGSTIAPPIIKVNQTKPQSQSTEQPHNTEKPQDNEESDPSIEDSQDSLHHKPDAHAEYQDSTEDPVQEVKNEQTQKPHDAVYPTNAGPEHVEPVEENQEEEEIDSELPDYDEDYTQSPPTTTQLPSTTTTTTTKPPTTPSQPITTSPYPSPNTNPLSSPSPSHPSLISPTHSTGDANPTLDPASLTPQEFIYRHRGPGSEAISFQRQGFRPADGVYITHAPPQQFDHFQYESSRTAPRPPQPVPFVKRPSPAPFRATTIDPREQLLRPGPSSPTLRPGQASQPSERHETSVQHRPHPHPAPLPAQRPLPFDPYYYERKRSDDPGVPEENESTLSARSVGPPVLSVNRPVPQAKYKSPPRVIVTASASVSDSNGKRLNYTVGNVVSAVKPIVPINYDDYKESDLIFDPFFLDVPKLQKRRKSRGSRSNQKVIPLRRTFSDSVLVITTTPRVTSQATTTERGSQTKPTPKQSTTTPAWNPKDYVDDNYEPQIYADKYFPHLAIDINREKWDKEKKPTRDMKGYSKFKYDPIGLKVPSSTQSSSSQIPPVVAPAAAPSLIVEPLCVFADCRNNA